MSVAIGDTILVTSNMFWADIDNFQHTWHCRYTGTAAETDANVKSAITAGLESIYNILNNSQSDQLTYGPVDFYNVTQDAPMGSQEYSAAISGDSAATPMPTQCQMVVLYHTGTKRSVSKKFIPGIPLAATEDGQVFDSATVASIAGGMDEILTPFTTANGELTFGNYRAATTFFIPWISQTVRRPVFTQRRRRLGVGR